MFLIYLYWQPFTFIKTRNMKKLLVTTNLLLVGIVLFMACNHKFSDGGTNTQRYCAGRMCKDYANVEIRGIVSGDMIQKMSEAYSRDPGKSNINYDPAARGVT